MNTNYEANHTQMKKWNEDRAKAEQDGLARFHQLKETFAQQKNGNWFGQKEVCCSECGKSMDATEHNYGTDEILVCIHCYHDAQ